MDPRIDQVLRDISRLQSQIARHKHVTIDGTSLLDKTAFITVSLPDTQSQTSANYGICFVATRPCFVKAISEVHTVAGSSTPTLQIERLQDTTAPGSGTVLLTTAFQLNATANTVQRGSLISLPSLGLGDRLALKISGTLTNLKGVAVTLEIQFI